VTGNPDAPTTYAKNMAGQFGKDEAERLSQDWSDFAATKGYGYRYQVEEAGAELAHQNRAHASVSP
jgi:hypothetical protein